jgi:K+-sensing histidine kinase KdpD
MTVDYRRVDVAAMLRRVTDQSSAAVTGRSMVFSINAPDSLLPDVDPDKFQRVLLTCCPTRSSFTLSVRDHGEGLPRPDRDRIFERSFAGQGDGHHSGLGLYLAKRLVDLHGGQIVVESPSDGGARFVVQLPLAAPGGPLNALSWPWTGAGAGRSFVRVAGRRTARRGSGHGRP